MNEAEFDRFAAEYEQLHAHNIRVSGEGPQYFAEYKVVDAAKLLKQNPALASPSILDFGSGIGTSVRHFRQHFPNGRLTCLDVSRKSLELGRSLHADAAEFVHFDGVQIPFPDNHFDMVFLACVLHHIPHSEHVRILRELRRVLRRFGLLVVFEHNPYNPLTVHAVNTCPFDENAVLLKPHRLHSIIATAGFAKPSVRFRIFFPYALRALRPLESAMTWIPIGAQYFVHATKD